MKLRNGSKYVKPAIVNNPNNDLQYRILKSAAEIIEYEQLLYKEFSQNNLRSWVNRHYLKIDGSRYRSPIPYSEQSIYGVYEDSKLISAIAINFNTEREMQLEEVGFNLNRNAIDCHYCEALSFFCDRHKHHHSFEVLRNLRIFLSNDLKAKNISFVLSTCSRSVIHLYERFGWSIVTKKIIDRRIKYLIQLEILPHPDLQQLTTNHSTNQRNVTTFSNSSLITNL